MSTRLDQAHNAIDRKLFAMKGFHHPGGSQAAFLSGPAHLYNLIPYQRRAKNARLCGVEVEGGRGTQPVYVNYYNWLRYKGTRNASPLEPSKVNIGITDSPYTTVVHVDAAIDALKRFNDADPDQPWLMYIAFNAPHAPYTCPPSDLRYSASCATRKGKYHAMIEAMDKKIGHLITTLDTTYSRMAQHTTVIFIGDNGTPPISKLGPENENFVKGSIYEGGIHVPFIARRPLISGTNRGSESNAMVHAVDFYATVAEIAGAPLSAREIETQGLDSVSFVETLIDPAVEGRDYVMSEGFSTPELRNVNRLALRDHWPMG